ncbi:polyamine aminopropyltransferase [Thalassoroseus pseudoceratinae]|uniref:polyamine aminopropyltransferase n=1 Tax=Thalassoroseus pseudoceratinae TaxID=2713176 RepID=UPI001981A257|nr:polyamine aminopropyltransferase [Thalassoroseus pseudoceratinae]
MMISTEENASTESEEIDSTESADGVHAPLLFLNVFVIATCGLVYELVAGTLASYLLGDSVTQFSICIGLYLSAMGCGAWLSGWIDKSMARCFIEVELAVALIGGLSAPILFIAYAKVAWFQPLLYGLVFVIGTLVGLELPLLMRILREGLDFKDLVSRVLTFDYIGALAGSLLFPLLLVPNLGLARTSLIFGILNGLVGFWGTWLLRPVLNTGVTGLRIRGLATLLILVAAFVFAGWLTDLAEEVIYQDPIVFSETTKYQRIVVTQSPTRVQLFLDGKLQFNSRDEYRYHEALVHPAMASAVARQNVLILGGGDGLAAREVLKYDDVKHVTLVDLDPHMTALAKQFPPLAKLNQFALQDARTKVINQDAMIWIEDDPATYDVVIIDFPDPNNYALGKLYTSRFYRLLARRLKPDSIVALQATSPLFARKAYWCIQNTLAASGYAVHPYQITVPSFGVWGFGLAKLQPFSTPNQIVGDPSLKYLNDSILASLFHFPTDMARLDTEVNRLDNQMLVQYYERY